MPSTRDLTGGGYGPVVTSGGILSGADEKTAIAIQSLSESFISMVGFFYYFFLGECICWSLTRNTVVGVVLAAPLAAVMLEKIDKEEIKKIITLMSLVMGLAIMMKAWNLFVFAG